MQRVAVKKQFDVGPVERPALSAGTLDGAPHPMHQHLLARWSEVQPTEHKFTLPTRFAVLIGAALFAWALVGAFVWAVLSLV